MTRRATLLLCHAALSVGFLFGLYVESQSLVPEVLAQAAGARAQLSEAADADDPELLLRASRLLADVARTATPSVVHIKSERSSPPRGIVEETGSGVIVRSDRAPGVYVVTNRHVIHDAEPEKISIQLHDGRVINPLQILSDPATDVAVLKVNAPGLRPAQWGDSDEAQIGHMVIAMGSPFGLSKSVTFGIISAKGRAGLRLGRGSEVINQDFIQTDAAINPGNSGGPLIDLSGRIIGINTAIASASGGNEGIGFSIPSNLIRWVADELLENGVVQRGYLGVKLDPAFDIRSARRLQMDRVHGARIIEVYSATPASRAGLQQDDVILEFDGTSVYDENHLINLVSLTPVGERVPLVILREGRRQTVHVVLADRSALERVS